MRLFPNNCKVSFSVKSFMVSAYPTASNGMRISMIKDKLVYTMNTYENAFTYIYTKASLTQICKRADLQQTQHIYNDNVERENMPTHENELLVTKTSCLLSQRLVRRTNS